jgi:carboxymethylenebutenolidase
MAYFRLANFDSRRKRGKMGTDLIHIDSHGTAIPTEVFRAEGTAHAAIVVVHGSDGMNEPWAALIREYATELAGQGFTAFIPNYFVRTRTVPGPAVFAQMPENLAAWTEAVADVVGHVKALPQRVGLLGFSLGGHIALRLRGLSPAIVEFFAPELRQLGGLGASQPATAKIEIHHGLADMLVPFSETEAIASTLKNEGVAAEVFSYEGAGHGFAGSDPNNAMARRASRNRTMEFFQKNFQAIGKVHRA